MDYKRHKAKKILAWTAGMALIVVIAGCGSSSQRYYDGMVSGIQPRVNNLSQGSGQPGEIIEITGTGLAPTPAQQAPAESAQADWNSSEHSPAYSAENIELTILFNDQEFRSVLGSKQNELSFMVPPLAPGSYRISVKRGPLVSESTGFRVLPLPELPYSRAELADVIVAGTTCFRDTVISLAKRLEESGFTMYSGADVDFNTMMNLSSDLNEILDETINELSHDEARVLYAMLQNSGMMDVLGGIGELMAAPDINLSSSHHWPGLPGFTTEYNTHEVLAALDLFSFMQGNLNRFLLTIDRISTATSTVSANRLLRSIILILELAMDTVLPIDLARIAIAEPNLHPGSAKVEYTGYFAARNMPVSITAGDLITSLMTAGHGSGMNTGDEHVKNRLHSKGFNLNTELFSRLPSNRIPYSDNPVGVPLYMRYHTRNTTDILKAAWPGRTGIAASNILEAMKVDVMQGADTQVTPSSFTYDSNRQIITAPSNSIGQTYTINASAFKYDSTKSWPDTTKNVEYVSVSQNFVVREITSAPSAPAGLKAVYVSGGGFHLSWDPSSGASSYNVYRDNSFVTSVSGHNTTLDGFNIGQTYRLEITSVNVYGESARSEPIFVVVYGDSVQSLMPPTGLGSTNIQTNSLRLYWAAPADAIEYIVYKNEAFFAYTYSPFLDITELTADTLYKFEVRAVYPEGISGLSTAHSVTTSSGGSGFDLSSIAVPVGTLEVGHTLTIGEVAPADATYTVQWQRAGTQHGTYTNISDATGTTYTLVLADADKWIRTQATGTGSYSGTVHSTAVQVGEAPAPGPDIEITLPGGVIMAFKSIPAGTFQMGSLDTDPDSQDREKPRHSVTLTRSFQMGKYPVTQAQFEAIMGVNPSDFNPDDHPDPDALQRPVERVNWFDAIAFCNKLSIAQGLTPVYSVTGVNFATLAYGDIPTWSNPIWNAATAEWDANGYRLPTEAEWEYSIRAGTETRFYWGDDPDYTDIEDYAWYTDNNTTWGTKPVGQKSPNAFGLYDMSGNVREWCWDWHSETYYSSSPNTDPIGPASDSNGSHRACRGGAWLNTGIACRSANRSWLNLSFRCSLQGFRVLTVGP